MTKFVAILDEMNRWALPAVVGGLTVTHLLASLLDGTEHHCVLCE